MGAKKAVSGVFDAGKILRPDHRIIARTKRDDGAQRVGLQFEILGIGACADRGPDPLGALDRLCVAAPQTGQNTRQHRAAHGTVPLARQMACDMMRRLMAQNEGQFILIAGLGHKGDGKSYDRPAGLVHGLKRIGRHRDPAIHDDLIIAGKPRCLGAANTFCHRLYPVQHRDKVICSLSGA